MNSSFKVSVIIPVYNAEKYLEKAVNSAINLPEVGEIILVEDNSPDNALVICKALAKNYDKVKLLRHPNGENRGAGASRNLGIENADYEFIAFLDADDWYLPNRFLKDSELFKDETIDGVYNAVGYYTDSEGLIEGKLTTIRKSLNSEDLLFYLLIGHYGHFCTDGITIRKKLIKKTGKFVDLKLHQDTHLWYRLAFFGKLISGEINEPVAIRRVHSNNRIRTRNKKSQYYLMKAVYEDFRNYEDVDRRAMRLIIKKYIHSKSRNKLHKIINYMLWIFKEPSSLRKI